MMGRVLLFLTLFPLLCTQKIAPKQRLKALWNFGGVSECILHYNALIYNNYGCWCGVGGSHEPVDGIDRCCMLHDNCYGTAIDKKLCFDVAWEYIDNYSWKCINSTAICLENAQNHVCKKALCDCDVAAVKCWSHYPKPQHRAKCIHSKPTTRAKRLQH